MAATSITASHLAGAVLDDNEGVLADGAGLLREGRRRAGVRRLECCVVLVLGHPARRGQCQEAQAAMKPIAAPAAHRSTKLLHSERCSQAGADSLVNLLTSRQWRMFSTTPHRPINCMLSTQEGVPCLYSAANVETTVVFAVRRVI